LLLWASARREFCAIDFDLTDGHLGVSVATVTLPAKLRREDVPQGEVLCAYCSAKCCRYFALPLETPTTWSDFDFIRWFLLHKDSSVFLEDDTWYLIVHTVCKHLQPDQRCGIYETRPQVCRDYSTENCEYDDDWVYDRYFETAEQIYEYAEALLGPPPGASFRSPPPSLFPIIA
jgi:Fe-S-cluster containining protein